MIRMFLFLAIAGAAHAQPAIDIAALAAAAAKRFPQPVRVGDLLGQDVLRPLESQPVLGHVAAVTRRPDGGLDMVVWYGGVLGIGARPVAVPVEAMALLGPSVVAVGVTPEQLDRLPTAPGTAVQLGPDERIKVGIVRPFH